MFKHLGALMITSQLIGQVTESLIPYIMFKSRVTKVSKEGKKIVMKTADLSDNIERQGTQEQYLVSYESGFQLSVKSTLCLHLFCFTTFCDRLKRKMCTTFSTNQN